MTEQDADLRFGINAIAQLRGDILHRGKRPAIRPALLRMVSSLYEDALLAKLKRSPEGRAGRVYPNKPFRLREYVNNSGMSAETSVSVDVTSAMQKFAGS